MKTLRVCLRTLALGMVCIGFAAGLFVGSAHSQQLLDSVAEPTLKDDPLARIKEIAQKCFACHGEGGVSRLSSRPTIAGQNQRYLQNQFQVFKKAYSEQNHGRPINVARSDTLMNPQLIQLTDAEINLLATYLSQLPCDGNVSGQEKKTSGEKSDDTIADPSGKVEDIAQADIKVPPLAARCSACHGEKGISKDPLIPNLAGQKRGYMRSQLLAFREEGSDKPDAAIPAEQTPQPGVKRHSVIMAHQVSVLSIEQIDQLSAYYASLTCRP